MQTSHKLLLFDLDGTISDPIIGICRSINYALSHYGYAEIEMTTCADYIGPPLDDSFRIITGASQGEVAALVAKYRERYADVGFTENTLYPEVAAALGTLAQSECAMAVCTSKRRDFAERILTMFNLRDYFLFVDGGDTGVQKWQQIETLHTLGKVSNTSVMIGDRAIDMVAAHRNGLSAAGVLWGYGSREELEAEQPRYLFNSPIELATLIANE